MSQLSYNVVTIAAVAAAAYLLYDLLKPTAAINATVAAISSAINPPGFTATQQGIAAADIQPTNDGGFTSGLADYVVGMPAGTHYGIVSGSDALFIVDPTNGWYESGFTRQNLINQSVDYYRSLGRWQW